MPRKPAQPAKRQKAKARKPRAAKVAQPVAAPAPTVSAPATPSAPQIQRIRRAVSWPADWKQAVWERFAPNWALLRWPVRYEERVWWEEQAPNGVWSLVGGGGTGGTGTIVPANVNVTETTGSRGVYTITTVTNPPPVSAPQIPPPAPLHEDEDPYLTPKQMGWDDAERGVYNPEIYGEETSCDYIRYLYGWCMQKAGKPFPLGLD
jgi:hypothetical protein